MNKRKKKKKISQKNTILLVSFVLFVVLFMFGAIVGNLYFTSSPLNFLRPVYKLLPLPILQVGEDKNSITTRQLFNDVDAVRHFYESKDYTQLKKRVDFSTAQGVFRLQVKEREVLNKLVEDEIIRQVAKNRGIKVTAEEIDKAVEDSLLEAGSTYQQLTLSLQDNYGWTVDEFKEKIVKNQLYLKKLFQWYQKSLVNSAEYKRLAKIEIALRENAGDFEKIAKKESEGDSAKQGGEMNWMEEEQIIPEVANRLKKMNKGDVSEIIISPLGFHIVLLEDKKSVDDGDKKKEEFKFKQIFIKGVSFVNWLKEQKKETPVKVLWKKYKWDKAKGEVIFSSEKMREIEDRVKLTSEGDPSI